MSIKVKKYSILIIAAVLVVALAFAGAASAGDKYISSADEWRANVSDTVSGFSMMNCSDTIYLTDDIDFEGDSANVVITWSDPQCESPKIEGNYHTISNFSISSPNSIGLFGDSFYGKRIANLTLSNFSVSSSTSIYESSNVGGLVGCINADDIQIENVRIEYGNVTGSSGIVGGLVGYAPYTARFENCTAESCMVAAGSGTAGGLAASADYARFDICKVVNCSISASGTLGGLVGSTYYMSYDVCTVKNCILATDGSGYVGGLVGGAFSPSTMNESVVENTTIVSAGGNNVGGLVGFSPSTNYVFNAGNKLKASAVRGYNSGADDYVGEVVGCDVSSKKDITDYSSTGNVSKEGSVWLNNNSNANYPKIYIAKSADSSKQGPEESERFNNGLFGEPTGLNAILVTHLTGYGVDGQYEAFGYVYESAPEYPITNTSVMNGMVFAENATNPAGCITQAAVGDSIHAVAVSDAGYHFDSWNVTNSTDGTAVTVTDGNFTMLGSPVNVGAQFIVNTTNVTASDNKAVFGNDNITALCPQTTVSKVLLVEVSNVTNTAVNFTAENTSAVSPLPSVSGYSKEEMAVFEINATAVGTAKINLTVTFADATEATAKKNNVRFFHYNVSVWEPLTSTIIGEENANITYSVETTSFSPFGIGIYTALPPQYTPSSSKQTGSTVILQEGQTAPTAYATAAPTVAPTVKPTEQPATPTVIATEKPTTQATQASPAPFVGLLAGLGAAAVLLRLRK